MLPAPLPVLAQEGLLANCFSRELEEIKTRKMLQEACKATVFKIVLRNNKHDVVWQLLDFSFCFAKLNLALCYSPPIFMTKFQGQEEKCATFLNTLCDNAEFVESLE